MEVVKIKAGGFCAGVRLAIEKARAAVSKRGKAYAYSPLVHNEEVTSRLEGEGLLPFDREHLEQNDRSLPVVLSAHGHPSSLEDSLKEAGFAIVDATCPFVKANEEAIAADSRGHDIVYLGQPGHEEAQAASSFGSGRVHLIDPSSSFDVPKGLANPLIYVQTTLSGEDIKKAAEAIREEYPEAKLCRGPCRATEERQNAVKGLDGSYDLIVVVGSRNSANARALQKLAAAKGTTALLIPNAEEIDAASLKNKKKAAVIGAASTDEREIDAVVEALKSI